MVKNWKKLIVIIIMLISLKFLFYQEVELEYLGWVSHPDSLDVIYLNNKKSREEKLYRTSPCTISNLFEKRAYEKKWNVILPNVDFSNNYLYLPFRSKLISIHYIYFSENPHIDAHKGFIKYERKYYKGKTFVYKSDKIKVKPFHTVIDWWKLYKKGGSKGVKYNFFK